MKKKKIKKLAKLIFFEASKLESKNTSIKLKEIGGIEYDKDVSDRFYNFISNLVKLRNILRIEVNNDFISIYGDLNTNTTKSNSPVKENRIEIRITRDGFTLSKDYAQQHNYQDTTMLDRIRPKVIDIFKSSTKESILGIMDEVIVSTGLSRENNLDEILKD